MAVCAAFRLLLNCTLTEYGRNAHITERQYLEQSVMNNTSCTMYMHVYMRASDARNLRRRRRKKAEKEKEMHSRNALKAVH